MRHVSYPALKDGAPTSRDASSPIYRDCPRLHRGTCVTVQRVLLGFAALARNFTRPPPHGHSNRFTSRCDSSVTKSFRLPGETSDILLGRVSLRNFTFHIEVTGQRKTSVFPKPSSYDYYCIINLLKKCKADYKNNKKGSAVSSPL